MKILNLFKPACWQDCQGNIKYRDKQMLHCNAWKVQMNSWTGTESSSILDWNPSSKLWNNKIGGTVPLYVWEGNEKERVDWGILDVQ